MFGFNQTLFWYNDLKDDLMKRIFAIFFLLIFSLNLLAEMPKFNAKAEKEILKHFNLNSINTQEIIELSGGNDLFLKTSNGEKELGIVVLTSAKGRYDMFDYMIIYNQNMEIEFIKILVYRSEYGSEITAKRWLSQFYSRQEDNLKYGSDIQAISGATFSAGSLTNNINRINKILNEYKSD